MGGEQIDPGSKVFVYVQLAVILRDRIRAGEYPPGRRIPSKKEAMQEFGVGDHTYDKAVAILRDEGLVETVSHRGSFVSEAELQAAGAWWRGHKRAPVRTRPVILGHAGLGQGGLSCQRK